MKERRVYVVMPPRDADATGAATEVSNERGERYRKRRHGVGAVEELYDKSTA